MHFYHSLQSRFLLFSIYFQILWENDLLQDLVEDEHDSDFEVPENVFADDAARIDGTNDKLRKFLQNPRSYVPLDVELDVNEAEMLLGVLKFAKTYSLPFCGLADLCKLQNSMLKSFVLPDSQYALDQLLNPPEGITYHAVCSGCREYIGTFTKEQRLINCSTCDAEICLKDGSYYDYFVLIDVKKEISNLLIQNWQYYKWVVKERVHDPEVFRDIYDGKCYRLFLESLEGTEYYVTFTFNADGSPVFKSSKFSIWPVQIIINELPFSARSSRPTLCMLWFGKDKPDMKIFLQPFVDYMNQLSNNGISVIDNEGQEHLVKCFPLCCCVDSVARAPMQGLIQFNGKYGCNWCYHPGEQVHHIKRKVLKYPCLDDIPESRAESDTLTLLSEALEEGKDPEYGWLFCSPLIDLPRFDIIDGFVPDFMHNCLLGVARKFIEYWFKVKGKPYSLTDQETAFVDNILQLIKVPLQVARRTRLITDKSYWNSRELENWVLFYSLPILRALPRFCPYVKHWASFVEAMHILLESSISAEDVRRARDLLQDFVTGTEFLYGKDAMTFNIHQLLHLAQSVVNGGLYGLTMVTHLKAVMVS